MDNYSHASARWNLQEINSMPLLGMKLEKSEALLSLLESRLTKAALTEKLKASSFPIAAICVGNWKRVSKLEGELTGKVYYAKKRFVWEILVGQLKIKMEISWSDITAIQAVMEPNQPGYLQLELANPPLFFRETTPQPRKHTNWQQASDFTGGQAPIYRRHIAICPPGALNTHYEKLLRSDKHLFQLSRKPFPTHHSPYFNTVLPLQSLHFSITGLQHTTLHQPPPLNPTPTRPPVTARNNGGVEAVWGNQINSEAKFVESSRPSVIPHQQQQQHYEYEYNEISFPHQQQQQHYEYEYNEMTLPYMDVPAFNQNPTIPPISYFDHSAIHCGPSDEHLMQNAAATNNGERSMLLDQMMRQNAAAIHCGPSDEHLMQNAAAADNGEKSMLLDQMMRQNAAAAGDDGECWSLLDQIRMQNVDDHGSWLGEQVMKQNASGDDSWLAPHIQGISNHEYEVIDYNTPNLDPNHRFT